MYNLNVHLQESNPLNLVKFTLMPSNRDLKRRAMHEMERTVEKLQDIEFAFYYDILFGYDEYDEVYQKYHEIWTAQCDFIFKRVKPKWIAVNVNYFSDNFAPIENLTK